MSNISCPALYYFDDLSYNTNFILAMVYIYIAVVTSIVNLLLIASLISTKQALSNTSNILIVCLSVIDSLNGTLNVPLFAVVRFIYQKEASCTILAASLSINMFLVYLSAGIVILIAIDRYLHMRTSLERRKSIIMKLFTGKWIILPLSIVTFVSASISTLSMLLQEFGFIGIITTTVFVTLLQLTLVLGISSLYIRGYFKIRAFVRTNPVYNDAAQHSQVDEDKSRKVTTNAKRKEPLYLRNLQKTVLMLVIALMVTYTPYIISAAARAMLLLLGKETKAISIFCEIAVIIFYCNFTIDCLIIFKMNKTARSWALKRIKCWESDQDSHPTLLNRFI